MSQIVDLFVKYYILSIISGIIATIVCAVLADRKGRSVGGWIVGGLLLGWVGVIILACLSNQSIHPNSTKVVEKHYYHNQSMNEENTEQISVKSSPTHRWRCHNCNQLISADPCPFCGQVFSTESDSDK